MAEEITIKVGFGDQFRDLTVRIQDGDIPPWQPDQQLDVVGQRKPRLDAVAKVTRDRKICLRPATRRPAIWKDPA